MKEILYMIRNILLILMMGITPLVIYIPHVYAIGSYQAGYDTAKSEYLHNKSYSYSCSPANGKAYCEEFKVGYDSGWDVARVGWFGDNTHKGN